jgi:hypothetical protein
MAFEIDQIFLPSTGVDMVFDIDSLTPHSRSSIIYDIDFKHKKIIIAQTTPPFSKHTDFKQLDITTIIQTPKRRVRLGLKCTDFKIIPRYPLANKSHVPAVQLSYKPPVRETNIRSAFRLPLNENYIIKAKIAHKNIKYASPDDFFIRDISLTGIGLVIPRKKKKAPNPLAAAIKTGEKLVAGIILIDMKLDKPVDIITVKAQVTRVDMKYSDTSILAGVNFLNLKQNAESSLHKFIHQAQIETLKKLSRLD